MSKRPVRPVRVKGDAIDTSGSSKTTIKSAALTEGLIRDQKSALDLLGEISPVDVEDIAIDDRGRVVIDDEEFVTRVGERLGAAGKPKPKPGPKPNIICGIVC